MESISIYLVLGVLGGMMVFALLAELAKVVVHKIFPTELPVQTPCTACIQIRNDRDLRRSMEQAALAKEIEGLKEGMRLQDRKVDAVARLQLKMAIKMGVDIDSDIREIF